MTRYVIDAPTLLHIVANGIEPSPHHQIVAPNIIRSQALSLLFAAVRTGDVTEDLALEHHQRLTELKMRLLGDRVLRRTAWQIARDQGWETLHDAEYLAVTELQADALVTSIPRSRGKHTASYRSRILRRSPQVEVAGRPFDGRACPVATSRAPAVIFW